jgi:hypothetical protein
VDVNDFCQGFGVRVRNVRQKALDALNELVDRLYFELDEYERFVKENNDEYRQLRVSWMRKWLETEKQKIINDIGEKITVENYGMVKHICDKISLAIQRFDLAKERDMTQMDNWDMVWKLVEDCLPCVQDAVRNEWWIKCNLPPAHNDSIWQIYHCTDCGEVFMVNSSHRWELSRYGSTPFCPFCRKDRTLWLGRRDYDPPHQSYGFYYACVDESCGLHFYTIHEIPDEDCCPNHCD